MIRGTASIIEKNTSVYDKLLADVKELNGSFVKVGFPSGGKVGEATRDGSGHEPYADMSEVARVAVWNEFGVPKKTAPEGAKKAFMDFWHIPPRPFFRTALDQNREAIQNFMDRCSVDVVLGRMKAKEALEAVGIFIQDKIKRSITAGNWKPNAPRTIEEKGSSRPLIDSGQMRNSVTFTTHGHGESREIEGTLKV